MKVSVIVPVYNAESTIKDLLLSLDKLDYSRREMEIIIVDNGSEDRSLEIVKQFPYTLLVEPERRNSYIARNRGVSFSKGEILAFTDSDCVVSSTWLKDLVRGFDNSDVGGVAGKIIPIESTTPVQKLQAWLSIPDHSPNLLPYPFAATANVAYRRDVFERVGKFDGRFKSGGDVDFAIRVQKEGGFSLRFLKSEGVVYHRNERNPFDLMARARSYGRGHYLLSRKHSADLLFRQKLMQRTIFRVAAELTSAHRLRDLLTIILLESGRLAWDLSFEIGLTEARKSKLVLHQT